MEIINQNIATERHLIGEKFRMITENTEIFIPKRFINETRDRKHSTLCLFNHFKFPCYRIPL